MMGLGLFSQIFERGSKQVFYLRFFSLVFAGAVARSASSADSGNGDIGDSSFGASNTALRGLQVAHGPAFSRILESSRWTWLWTYWEMVGGGNCFFFEALEES